MHVGRQHAQGGWLAQPLRGELLGDQRRPEQLVLQPVAPGLGDIFRRHSRQGYRRAGRGDGGRGDRGRHGHTVEAIDSHHGAVFARHDAACCTVACMSSSSVVAAWGRAWPSRSAPRAIRWLSWTGRPRHSGASRTGTVPASLDRVSTGMTSRRQGRSRPTPWRQSPVGTTRTSSPCGSRGKTTRSPTSWPASTTPAGPRSTSASGSRPWPPSPGRSTRSGAACCPTRTSETGPTRPGGSP